jgi:hypothetical protein
LRSAGARKQTEIDLGKSTAGRRHRNPEMSAERNLETAPQRRAMNCGNDWLSGVLHGGLHVGQRTTGRPLASKLRDVRTGDERAAFADQNDRLRVLIAIRGENAFEESRPHVGRQGVDRWRVQRQDGDIAFEAKVGDFIDGRPRRLRGSGQSR